MKNKLKFIKAILGIAILAFLVSFSAQRNACKNLKNIKTQIDYSNGNYFINDSLVNLMLNNKKMQVSKTAFGNLNISAIEQKINSNSFVKTAEVNKDTQGNLYVSIKQETPIARINTPKEEFYLTSDNHKIPLSSLYAAEVIMIAGDILPIDYEGLNKLTKLIKADKLLKKQIIAIQKKAPNSFILMVNSGGYVIELGRLEDIKNKLEKLKLFYNQYLGKVGNNYYKIINLKYKNQVVATKRDGNEK